MKIQFRHFLSTVWLPLALVMVFVSQNHLFNFWLNISAGNYALRRTVVAAALGTLLYAPSLLLRRPFKYPYLAAISTFVALILCAQYLYYSYSGGFLQASVLLYAGEGASVLGTVKTLLNWRLLAFVVEPLVVITAWILSQWNFSYPINSGTLPTLPCSKGGAGYVPPLWKRGGRGSSMVAGEGVPFSGGFINSVLSNKQKLITAATIALIVVAGYGYLFLVEKREQGNAALVYNYSKLYDVNTLVGKTGVVNFFLGDTIALVLHADKVNAADASFVQSFKAERQALAPESDFGKLKGRNVIMVQVESLENAVIGQKFQGQEITPNLNKLAGEGLYFSNYYSPIGPGTTADAEFMTLNSLYSLPDTVAFVQYAYDKYAALPALLKQNGYGAYSFHGDVPSFWNRANIYPRLGYEKWFSRDDYTIPRKIGVYDLGDKDFFDQSIPKLAALPRPFMATLITLTSHTPFELPADLQTLNIPENSALTWQQKGYLQTIHYTDQAIGDFIDELKTAGLYDNSIILIYGDHGSFTDIGTALGVDKSVFPDLQASQVPMFILAPGTSLKGERTAPASHLDLYPTVADILGIKAPPEVFGHDMIDGNDTVAVSRDLVSGTVNSFLTNKLAFHAGSNGAFASGECLAMPGRITLEVGVCQALYDKETAAVKASDIMVRGNLIDAK